MKRPELLVLIPVSLCALIFFSSGLLLFGLIFALITALFGLELTRRAAREKERSTAAYSQSAMLNDNEEDYRILGLKPGASSKEVRRVYKQLAAQFHPDTGAPLSEEQRRFSSEAFVRIRTAHDRIMARSER